MTGPAPAGRAGIAVVIGLVATVVAAVAVASVLLRGAPVVPVLRSPSPQSGSVGSAEAAPAPPVVASGTALVTLGVGPSAHPSANVVVDLFDRHFTAINRRDHAGWAATVSTDRATAVPEAAWLEAYRSTTDSAVEIVSIDGGGPDVTVGLSFVSVQQPEDAPPDLPVSRICWTSAWPVAGVESGGRIGTPAPGSTSRRAC